MVGPLVVGAGAVSIEEQGMDPGAGGAPQEALLMETVGFAVCRFFGVSE